MAETLKLCVSCKACRRECPTGVDMARMKIEVQAARTARFGLSLHDWLVGYLPRYAPAASALRFFVNLRNTWPWLARLLEKHAGFSARRPLPAWRKPFKAQATTLGPDNGREVVLFADTFNRYFEPENVEAAVSVLLAAGCRVHLPQQGLRPLCCGRTFLTTGKIDEARREAQRSLEALAPYVGRGVPVIGLEPSCLMTFRDEIPALLQTEAARQVATRALMFEEFVAQELKPDSIPLGPVARRALLHGHCHQKSFDVMRPVTEVLKRVPGLAVETVESSCCGMAGAFGYGADTVDVSLRMGELSLLPAVRKAAADTLVVADGTSCRHQIKDGAGRDALHVARVLAMSVAAAKAQSHI
jgi:Fe-S oxidoreductase